ncbi:hypothetical protein BC835DRAFT_280334 [Cytidiella melzeri]|nr:hypothetical protein BC835DRAFT_280334 [Cytidiella melzeri]
MGPEAIPAEPWPLRERNTRVATAGRPVQRRKAPFIPPSDVIELTDSSDDEHNPPQPLPAPQAPVTRPQKLFLPDSDDEQPKDAPHPSMAGIASDQGHAPVVDPIDAYVAQVLDIVPDVDPIHVASLARRYTENVLEQVIHLLFENPNYPKVGDKGKGKRKRDEEDEVPGGSEVVTKVVKIDYASVDRQSMGGPHYHELSVEQLRVDFPFVPMFHIRRTFARHHSLYAPTYLALQAELQSDHQPYQRLASASRNRSKGKQAERVDPALDEEKQWIRLISQEDQSKDDAEVAAQLQEEEDAIECGCCFADYPFDKMVQCPETHLFCRNCVSTYAAGKLGEHDINIVCMDQSGCKLAFPESELRRFLPLKLLELYVRVKQRKEIEAAGLENLEECPFCEYKAVIDNEHEKLFRCERDDCGAVSCRACKKLDHLPKSCQEAEEDKKLDGRHAIEEAMTRALLRNCPKCDKAFMKESGCNKMTCPNCHTVSCYVCRQVITGYDHFNQKPPYNHKVDPTKCDLWDSVDKRHADEVIAAAKKAIDEYKQAHPEANDKDLHVELPKPVAGPSNTPPGAAGHVPPMRAPRLEDYRVGPRADHHHHHHHHHHPHPPAPQQQLGFHVQVANQLEAQENVRLRELFERNARQAREEIERLRREERQQRFAQMQAPHAARWAPIVLPPAPAPPPPPPAAVVQAPYLPARDRNRAVVEMAQAVQLPVDPRVREPFRLKKRKAAAAGARPR